MHGPYTMAQAVSLAKKHEKVINARERKFKEVQKGTTTFLSKEMHRTSYSNKKIDTIITKTESKPDYRKVPGACWKYGERYF